MTTSINQHFSPWSLLKFAFPSIIMMMFMSLYTIVDGIFVSRFVGSNALSSLNIAFPAASVVIAVGTMLATGGSAIDAITQIKKHGAKRIKFIGLIAAPEGIKALHEAHPDVDIYLGAEDDHLNENGYIVPGLGDAGDRIYGTK